MKLFKILSALSICFFALNQSCYAVNKIKYFVIWHDNGSSTALTLNEHPRIKVDATNKLLICSTNTCEISLNISDVRRYSFEDTTDITSVDVIPATNGIFDKVGQTLVLSNFASKMQVNVYNTAGILKENHTTDKGGNLTIHTQNWEEGLYIIKTEKTVYKILIK